MTARAGLGLAVLAAAGCAGIGSPGAADLRPPATSTPSASPAAEPTSGAEPEPAAEPAPAPPPDDAVPWDMIETYYEAGRGRYTEVVQASEDGRLQHTLMQETVRYDLEVPYIERTVRMPTDEADPLGDLRFVYTDTAMLMWNPGVAETCGTPWIDMSDADFGSILGYDPDPDELLVIKPLDILDGAVDEPRHIETTDDGSTYHVTVPAEMTLPMSSDMAENPETYEPILDLQVEAEVLLPPDGESLRMTIDLTEVYRAIDDGRSAPANGTIRTSWTLTPDIPPFTTTLPADIADMTCMDPGTAM